MDGEMKEMKKPTRKAAYIAKRRERTMRGGGGAPRNRKTGSAARRMAGNREKTRVAAHAPDYAAGVSDGATIRSHEDVKSSSEMTEHANGQWNKRYFDARGGAGAVWTRVRARSERYAAGYAQGAGLKVRFCLVPLRKKASAVVCAEGDEAALERVLAQLDTLPLQEIVIVAGGASDRMFTLARNRANAVIVNLPQQIDADVGRALGAKLTGADIVLFVDGQEAVAAPVLAKFLWECDGKADVALNDLSAGIGKFRNRKAAARYYEFMNATMNRTDLKMNTLSALPYALSRNAIDALGASALSVPAKAHAMAIMKGLRITIGTSAGSGGRSMNPAYWALSAGDHVEAWKEVMDARGRRLHFPDGLRNRNALGEWER
ncbi:hypothetical protein [Cohnella soli]|uniref:Glycosyltransferase n=1 Tax=Cohnella soli TaxID=425005 RepID=A0ABW0HYZ3_9BACL